MNVNKVNKYTSTVETTSKRLNRFYQPHGLHTTFDSGKLIPIYIKEVLPNDVRKLKWSAVTRLLTPKFPTMDNAKLDTFFFYVRNRDIWDNWEEFMGYSKTQWTPTQTYSIPKLIIPLRAGSTPADRVVGDLADYMGIPVLKSGQQKSIDVNALPFRAVCKIWNDYFRDENYQDELFFPTGDNSASYVRGSYFHINNVYNGAYCPPVNRYKDYFSSCLPSPQRGSAVQLPLGDYAPLSSVVNSSGNGFTIPTDDVPYFELYDSSSVTYLQNPLNARKLSTSAGVASVSVSSDNHGSSSYASQSVQLPYAADLSKATAASVNALRLAFQTQRFLEQSARGGTRYTELLQSMFGVNAPDLMLNRAEFLGGKSFPLSLTPVTNTANDLGAVGGMSNTVSGDYAFKKHFTEHGYIIGFCCVRTDRSYSQGLERHWFRKDKEDFYFPVFSHIGEQPVLNREIFVSGNSSSDEDVWGYQEAWTEYRTSFNQCSGYMRSGIDESLNVWTYTDDYQALPSLNSSWLTYQKEIIDRTITNYNEHQFIADFYFDDVLYSVVSKNSAPGLIDHY